MTNITENIFTFLSSDGKTEIYVKEWIPETINGVIAISHGMAEHKERYTEFAKFMCSHGFAVCAHDHLGHGQSISDESCKGFLAEENGWFCLVDDLEHVRKTETEKFGNVPFFMLGHSMGTFVLRTYLEKYPDSHLNGAIISGTGQNPALILTLGRKIAEKEVKKYGAKQVSRKLNDMAFGKYNKKIINPRTQFDWLSVDNDNVDGYVADPLCGFIMTAGFFADMMSGLQYIWKKENLSKMNKNIPVLFVSGDCDPVGDYGKSVIKVAGKFQKNGMNDVTVKLYSGYRHEILNESEIKETVMDDIYDWIINKNDSVTAKNV